MSPEFSVGSTANQIVTSPLILADASAELFSSSVRMRASGRIGGIVATSRTSSTARNAIDPGVAAASGLAAPQEAVFQEPPSQATQPQEAQAQEKMRRALGANAAILGRDDHELVVDSDSCRLDSQPIRTRDEWKNILVREKLPEVRGAFALAWHRPDGSLFLARDALGERALFHASFPGGIIFASTLQGILATNLIDRRLDLAALASYLVYAYLPGEETLIETIRELLPGESLIWRDGQSERNQFWRIPSDHCESNLDEIVLRDRLRADLETAVLRRLTPGVPVAATLSGGIDSSLVVALLCKLHDAEIYTYSVSFGEAYPNELQWSSMVADHCKTRHSIVEISPAAILRHLDDTIALLSDPIGDPLTVPNALLFREAARTCGTVFNGEGGDPSFGGPKNLPMILSELFGDEEDPHHRARTYLRAHLKCYDDLHDMLSPDARAVLEGDRLERRIHPHLHDERWKSFVNRLNAINVSFKGAHHILGKVDQIAFPFGVTPSSPLFDRDVVETAFMIPAVAKLKGSVEKFLLKKAVEDLLPRAIIDRPKSGMLVPVEGWFKGELLPHARERIMDGLTPYGLFQRDWLDRLIRNRLGGVRPRRGVKIWLLITLEAWLRKVFQG